MPVVARLNSVLCACKTHRCRRRRVDCVLMPCVAGVGFLRNQRSAKEAIPRKDAYRRRYPGFPSAQASPHRGWRCDQRACSPAALAARRPLLRRETRPRGPQHTTAATASGEDRPARAGLPTDLGSAWGSRRAHADARRRARKPGLPPRRRRSGAAARRRRATRDAASSVNDGAPLPQEAHDEGGEFAQALGPHSV